MATNQNILLVALSQGYQLQNTVCSQELWQGLHVLQQTMNFISSSGKKFYRTNIGSRVPLNHFLLLLPGAYFRPFLVFSIIPRNTKQ